MPDRPTDAPWLTPAQSSWLATRLAQERDARGVSNGPQPHAKLSATLLNPWVLVLSAIYFGRTVSMFGIAFFLPQLVKGLGFSNGATGVISALPYGAAIIGMLAWAHFSDRAADRRWHLIGTHVAAAVGLAAAAWLGASLWSLVAITVAAIGFSAQPGCFWPLPPILLGPTAAAGGIAMVNALGNLGGFAGPWGVGVITSYTGHLNDGLYFLAICPALSGLLVLLVPSGRRAMSPQ
jgi:ACS family tartrate transporter-like MFS transporter